MKCPHGNEISTAPRFMGFDATNCRCCGELIGIGCNGNGFMTHNCTKDRIPWLFRDPNEVTPYLDQLAKVAER